MKNKSAVDSQSSYRYFSKNTLDLSTGLGYKILYQPVIRSFQSPMPVALPVYPRPFPRYFRRSKN